jgi:alpha-mannosidase
MRYTRALLGSLLVLCLSTSALRAQDFAIRRWLLRGALPADTGAAGVVRDYIGGEGALRPDSGDLAAGGAFIVANADSLGYINFNRALTNGRDWSVAYAVAYVQAPQEMTALLVMDSDDDLVALLNGQRVWVNVVARGGGTGSDTTTVRLAAGWNTVVLKVRNRTGGFDVTGRLAPAPGERTLDGLRSAVRRPPELAAGHNRPAATIIASPIHLGGTLTWNGDALETRGSVSISAWGAGVLRGVSARFEQGLSRWSGQALDSLQPGTTASLAFGPTFAELRRAGLGVAPLQIVLSWTGGARTADLGVDADALLRALGGRIALGSWLVDSTGGTRRLLTRVVVPEFLGDQHVDLLAAEFGATSIYTVNGQRHEWRSGAVELCGPCHAGDSLAIAIALPRGMSWWSFPMARVREIGYPEYADGYGYARALAGRAPAISRPAAREWLAALGNPGDYTELTARYSDAYAPLAAEIRRDTLWLVGNSHIDAAWLWPWSETSHDVIPNTWRSSLRIASAFPGYVFAASAAAYFDAMDRLYPSLADSLTQAVASGAFALVGGWWVEPDQNLPSGESLARQGLYGQRYFQRRFGRRAHVAWTPDSFGYPWTLPQIDRLSGFDAFVTQKIRWNDSTQLPYDAFQWEGLDGTRIFTYNPFGYDHDLDPQKLVPERLDDRRRQNGIHNQMVLYGVGDHGGGPTMEMLHRAEDLRRVPTFPVMQYASPDTALAAMRRSQSEASFPVWRDELYLEYHRGTFTTQARQKYSLRHSEQLLRSAEALAVLDTAAYPRADLTDAWHRVLFNQFHDVLPGSGIRQIYLDANANYDTAWTALGGLIDRGLASLAARLDTRGPRRTVPVVVFNPLTWTRSGYVTLSGGGLHGVAWVSDVPALGAKVVWVDSAHATVALDGRGRPPAGSPADPAAGPDWIENAYLRVQVDTATGRITRITDKTTHREVLAPGQNGNVLEIFGDRPRTWDAWDIAYTGERSEVTQTSNVRRESDGERARISFTRRWGASTFSQTLELARGTPYLEVQNAFDWHETHKLLKVGFTLATAPDSLRCEIPYGVIGRAGRPRTQAERAKYEFPCQRWVDVADSAGGVAFLTESKYGWDYHGNVARLSLLRSPLWPDSTADRGRQEFRFAVLPHAGDYRAAQVERRAAEYNVPMLASVQAPHTGALGHATSLASVDAPNVEITWVKRAEDSQALVLRLVEWGGRPASATVTLRSRIRSARTANLLEDPGQPLQPSGNQVRVTLRPFEIATLLVELDR